MLTRSKKKQLNDLNLNTNKKRKTNKIIYDSNSSSNNSDNEDSENEYYYTKLYIDPISESDNDSESDLNDKFKSDVKSELDLRVDSNVNSNANSDLDSNVDFELNSDVNSDVNSNKSTYSHEFELLENFIYSIIDGTLFDNNNPEQILDFYKHKLSLKNIKNLNNKLLNIQENYLKNNINIINILKNDFPLEKQKKLLENIYNLNNCDILSPDYKYYVNEIKLLVNETEDDKNLKKIEQQIINTMNNYNKSYKYQILSSNMNFNNKVQAYKFLKIMESYDKSSSEELIKYKTWLNSLLSVPFGNYQKIILISILIQIKLMIILIM